VAKVEDKVLETYIKADAIWQRQFELPRLLFDLRGCCAGRACYRDYQIRLNPVLLLKNQTDFV
jgi:predicted SprT family Zn-dependent metalloprotease